MIDVEKGTIAHSSTPSQHWCRRPTTHSNPPEHAWVLLQRQGYSDLANTPGGNDAVKAERITAAMLGARHREREGVEEGSGAGEQVTYTVLHRFAKTLGFCFSHTF